jgi:hypothetical protein
MESIKKIKNWPLMYRVLPQEEEEDRWYTTHTYLLLLSIKV